MTGLIFDIKKFAIHDGPGIRTTVFLKGCPLTCLWCHNPESQSRDPEISYMPDKCIFCGYCAATCPEGCHKVEPGRHEYDRALCKQCGACTAECYAQALEVVGREMTVEETLEEVLKDKPFYETSGGGMTVSGGEPMAQFEFTRELLAGAKREGLHTCLDTSGVAPFARYRELLNLVDVFLYDLKETDSDRHREYTGAPLDVVLENLRRLDEAGATTVIRCPIVPGLNDRAEHLDGIADVVNQLRHVTEVNLLAYHRLGDSKLDRTGRNGRLKDITTPEESVVDEWIARVGERCRAPVQRS